MQTKIEINGQIQSVFAIARCFLNTDYVSKEDGRFNTITITYAKKLDAYKALRAAFKKLKEEDPKDGSLYLHTTGSTPYSITYDAGRAIIVAS